MNAICRGLLSAISCALFVVFVSGCEIHADNPAQKENTQVLFEGNPRFVKQESRRRIANSYWASELSQTLLQH